jgi:ribosome biogenesis GTPase A
MRRCSRNFWNSSAKFAVFHHRQLPAFPINLIRKVQDETESDSVSEVSENTGRVLENIQKINLQPIKDSCLRTNRFVLQFHCETAKEIRELREKARQSLQYVTEEESEIGDEYFEGYDFPVRPKWSYTMSKEILTNNEARYFFKYVTTLEKKHYDEMKALSYCELNIETWRQLWRVLELSDIVLVIADARFPTLMFPTFLFDYVTKQLNKSVIICLNKIDLVDTSVVLAWKKYFEEKYQGINVVLFTSCPSYNLRGGSVNKSGLKIRRRRGRQRMAGEGALQIFQACQSIVKDQVDLSSWKQKIQEEMKTQTTADDDDEEEELKVEGTHEEEKDFDFEEHVLFKNGVMTLGCVGFPNVGKSSLLNGLMGKKVVSVSRTPGHTKHFQTIFLTANVRLCDCPGLVFPSQTPRTLQVLMGSFPIAQLREPYASVRFLAERIDIPKLLAIKHPEGDDEEWSAMDICDAFALKRGFLTAKAARPDTYRAANSILRMALDGKITLSLKPRGYHQRKEFWESHPEYESVKEIQALGNADAVKSEAKDYCSDSEGESKLPVDYQPNPDFKRTKNDINNEDGDNEDSDTDNDAAGVSNPFDLLNDSVDN